jgi:hypothetical protein
MTRSTITRHELMAFARSLGVDPLQTQRIDIEPQQITVTTYHLDEHGNRQPDGPPDQRPKGEPRPKAATETAVIKVVGPAEGAVRMRHPNLDREVDVPATAVGHHAVAGWEVIEPEAPSAPERTPDGKDPAATPDDKPPEQPAPEAGQTPPRRRKSKESD